MRERNQRGNNRMALPGDGAPGLPNWQGLLLSTLPGYTSNGEHLQWAKAHFFVGAMGFVSVWLNGRRGTAPGCNGC